MSGTETLKYIAPDMLYGTMPYEVVPQVPKVTFGAYRRVIDEASQDWEERFTQTYGVAPSLTIAQKDYTRSEREKQADIALAQMALQNVYKRRAEEKDGMFELDELDFARKDWLAEVSEQAYALRKKVFEDHTPADLKAQLVVPDSIRDNLIDLSDTRTNEYSSFRGRDCALKTLLLYAPALLGVQGARIDADQLRTSLAKRGYPRQSWHDLYTLLYSLGGVHPDLGVTVRMTVGMGLGEMSEKIIEPLLEAKPSLRFGISLLALTTSTQLSNHVYVLSGAHGGYPEAYDSHPSMPATMYYTESLARRWFSTGMLSGIVIVNGLETKDAH